MLIGITGKAGHGKNTLGDMLSKLSGYPTLGLADTLKQKVNTIFGWDERHSFGKLKEEKLEYPKQFINDVRLLHEGFSPLLQKFDDIQIRYLMLSDFYDFARLTKKYKKQ